jgi:hypothetical protein
MGNTINPIFNIQSVLAYNARKSYLLKFDRILDGENEIYIGIGEPPKQVIRFGDYHNKTHKLLNFVKKENKLKYEFEDDITLILEKREDDIHIDVIDMYRNKTISKPIDPFIKKHWKSIALKPCSNELDEIGDFLQGK